MERTRISARALVLGALAAAVLLVSGCDFIEYQDGISGAEGVYSVALSQEGRVIRAEVSLNWETWQETVAKKEADGVPLSLPTDLFLWLRLMPARDNYGYGGDASFYPAARKRIDPAVFYVEGSDPVVLEFDLGYLARNYIVPELWPERLDGDKTDDPNYNWDYDPNKDVDALEVMVADGYAHSEDAYTYHTVRTESAYSAVRPNDYSASQFTFPSSLPRGIGRSKITGLYYDENNPGHDYEYTPVILPTPGLKFSAEESWGGQEYTLVYSPGEGEEFTQVQVDGVPWSTPVLDDSNASENDNGKLTWRIIFEPSGDPWYVDTSGGSQLVHIPGSANTWIGFSVQGGSYQYTETYYRGYPITTILDNETFDGFNLLTEPGDSNWYLGTLNSGTQVPPSPDDSTGWVLGLGAEPGFESPYEANRYDSAVLFSLSDTEAQAITDNQNLVLSFDRFKDLDYGYYDYVQLEVVPDDPWGSTRYFTSWWGPQDIAEKGGWFRETISMSGWDLPDSGFSVELRFFSNGWGTGKGFFVDNLSAYVLE
ncbi:hypothetical protein [Spirochaeta lutea]|uniref:Uncharacterized protein n=1 Tax=Spirochaeta lutea TaxID=1480694 RepID=A0A098QUM3_9SPIO|nr:hypothetical protein [Spirochaeta lutea]KGE71103.1 hypothetical protein DC28_12690 [Spirochaeta lutea]